jgi:hypothetical protein
MPSTSKKQAKFMAAAAHNPEFAKKAGIPVTVAKEFNKADTGTRPDLQKVAKPKTDHGKSKLFKEGGHMKKSNPFMEMIAKKKEAAAKKPAKKMAKGGGIESKGKTKGKMVTMKKSGRGC